MAKAKDILGGGALGLGPAILARNPEMLRGFGVLGNLAANKLEDREEDKARQAAAAAQPAPGMRKGGKVKKMAVGGSASKRADGCATKGKTRGKMI